MNHHSNPLISDLSDGSTDYGNLTFDGPRKRNPKFEKMRSSLKNTLFSTEKSQSLSCLPLSQNLGNNEEESRTPTSDMADHSHDHGTSRNNFQRKKNRSKGSLPPRPLGASFCSIAGTLSEIDDEGRDSFRNVGSITSLPFTPTHDDFHSENLGFGGYVEKEHPVIMFSKVEELKHEDSISIDESEYEKNHSQNFHAPHSLEYIESDSEHRPNIFKRELEKEVDEIKKDLEIENDPHIHFIKGNFYSIYDEGETLGEGTTGIVKKCTNKETQESFAVKVVRYRDDLEMLQLIVKEFKNHRKLNHKTIIKVYDLYIDYFKKKIYTVMELAECREMFEVLQDLGHYTESVASSIFKQILTGINYLHLNGVCHRDLKPNNILVSQDGKIVKITDFNVSKFIEKKNYSCLSTENYKMWTFTGTIAFTAPEVFQDSEYTEAIDMWSAGAVLFTMLCGYQPFQAEIYQDLIDLIKDGQYEFHSDPWDRISKQAKTLVKHCLDVNYKTRYSPSVALMDPWIANCGKSSDNDIPRTGYYFSKYQRIKNRIKNDKNNQELHQRKRKVEDKEDVEIHEALPDGKITNSGNINNTDHSSDLKAFIKNLHPKRGKTGPLEVKGLHLSFVLKLEKSFSFNTLDDPKHYGDLKGEICDENEEQGDAELSEGDQDIYKFFEDEPNMLHEKKNEKEKGYKNKKDTMPLEVKMNCLRIEDGEQNVLQGQTEALKTLKLDENKENDNSQGNMDRKFSENRFYI